MPAQGWVSMNGSGEYWELALSDAPESIGLGAAGGGRHAGRVEGTVEAALVARVRGLAAGHGIAPRSVYLAAFALLLRRLATQADLVVGYLGVDAGPLPLRFPFAEAATLSACVEEAAAVLGEAIANAAALAGSGQAGRAWQAAFADGVALAPRAGATLVGLELSPADAGDAVAVSLHFDRTLLDDGGARQWLAAWHNLLDAMLASPQAPIDGPDLLDATQARAPLERDAAAAVACPPVAAVHRLFEAQAARTPGATALVHGDRRLDYAALNARANRLARHLRALGVGADERVAIYVDRGMEVVLGLLAVLKAGGAYVPLDPTYPAERLAYTLADSAPRVLLTMSGMEHGAREVLGELPAALAVVDLVADEADWQALDPRDLDDGEC